jgi:hypothetical protein
MRRHVTDFAGYEKLYQPVSGIRIGDRLAVLVAGDDGHAFVNGAALILRSLQCRWHRTPIPASGIYGRLVYETSWDSYCNAAVIRAETACRSLA